MVGMVETPLSMHGIFDVLLTSSNVKVVVGVRIYGMQHPSTLGAGRKEIPPRLPSLWNEAPGVCRQKFRQLQVW